jgi:hypothetical protein
MVEHTLGEGLPGSVRSQFTIEAEGFGDWEVGLDSEHWRSRPLLLAEHLTTSLVEDTVNPTNGVFGTLDFNYQTCQPLQKFGVRRDIPR